MRPRWWLRWPTALLVGLLFAGLVAVKVQHHLARDELARVGERWAAVAAYENSRVSAMALLRRESTPDDAAVVNVVLAGLYREESAGLRRVSRALQDLLLADTTLIRLRRTMRRAIGLLTIDLVNVARVRQVDLRAQSVLPPDRSPPALKAFSAVDQQLRTAERRFHVDAMPTSAIRRANARYILGSAAATVVALHHYLDEPANASLAVVQDAGGHWLVRWLDLEHNTERSVSLNFARGQDQTMLVLRDHYLAYLGVDGQVFATSLDLAEHQPSVHLGYDPVFAGSQPNAVWVGRNGGIAEVDGTGRAVLEPAEPPAGGQAVSSVHGGLVLSFGFDGPIEIWDPLRRTVIRRVTRSGRFLAASGNTVAWVDDNAPSGALLHLTDVASGNDRIIDGHGLEPSVLGASFSPSGLLLAGYWGTDASNLTTSLQFGLVDVQTGVVELQTARAFHGGRAPLLPAWTPSGDRVFFSSGAAGYPISTMRIGADHSTILRYAGGAVAIVVLG